MGLIDFSYVSPEEAVRLSGTNRMGDMCKLRPYYDAFMTNYGPEFGALSFPLFALAMFNAGIATGKRIERAKNKALAPTANEGRV